jgi:patched 1
MTGGCSGVGRKILKWPEDLIIGGVKRDLNGTIRSAEAFQSVFLVSSSQDVYQRFKNTNLDEKPYFNATPWSPKHADNIIQAWQRNFTEKLYKHRFNQPVRRGIL